MNPITIRLEQPGDSAPISEVTAAAFLEATHTCGHEADLVEWLRAAGALALSLVAEKNGEIIGHVAASPVKIAQSSGQWFGVGPISVMPKYQRQGIGSQLMRAVLERMRATGARGCVLVGDPSFYRRFGFEPDPNLQVPEVPPEVCLALRFVPSEDCGVVTFHPAFAKAAGS